MENKDWREEFDEKFPCIQGQCDNNGTIRGSNGDPEQCQYCYEYRLPIKSFIESILQSKQEEIEKVKFTTYDEDERVKKEVVELEDVIDILK